MNSATQERPLSVQENALASAMIHKIGDTTVRFTIAANGDRVHQNPAVDPTDFDGLVEEFRQDPKESLAWARESLFAINRDTKLTEDQRSRRLDRYLDAYTSLSLKLDHAAFPATRPGEVRRGVPGYIPDGFVDMGGSRTLSPSNRSREMIVVDKAAIYERFKPELKSLFSVEPGGGDPDLKKKQMFDRLAQAVYFKFPYDHSLKDLGGDKVKLGELPEGVCRHQALMFQTLAQAAGLTSRVIKNELTLAEVDGVRHASNMVRVNHKWYMYDVTNPDFVKQDGSNVWRPGAVRVDRPPLPGEARTYEGVQTHSQRPVKWEAHDDMYWFIDEPATS